MQRLIIAAILAAMLAPAALAQQKTVKACRDEWRADKAANQAKGITEKAYIEQCRAGGATAQPSAAPAPKPATASAPRTTTAPRSTTASAPATSGRDVSNSGVNQYGSEAQARGRCPSGTVVWANLNSKIYHFAGHKDYGHTKSGAYMCEQDASGQGMRAAKNEKHP